VTRPVISSARAHRATSVRFDDPNLVSCTGLAKTFRRWIQAETVSTDDRLAAHARWAAAAVTARNDLDIARTAFLRAVRALYFAGGSIPEIAHTLDLADHRVLELLDRDHPPPPPGGGGPGHDRRHARSAAAPRPQSRC